jgi:predicted aminopeptidase
LGQVCAFLAFFCLTGCETGYYWHLAAGQARVLFRSQPIEDVLRRPGLPPQVRDGLLLVDSLRTYAARLGLDPSSSYTRYLDTEGQPIAWNVSACPPDRFAPRLWRFPIVGELPYKGFFTEARAREERERLQRQGLDVLLGPVSAYSTLGFLSDPVLSTMLCYPDDRLAELVLHELTHATVFARGQTDFDESLATYMGRAGTLEFLGERHGLDSPPVEQARARHADQDRSQTFVEELITSLDSLYARNLPRALVLEQRRQVLSRAQERFRSLQPPPRVHGYGGLLRWEIVNNALLLSCRRYHRDLGIFAQVRRSRDGSLRQALAVFASCGRAADPWACLRDSAATLTRGSEPADP